MTPDIDTLTTDLRAKAEAAEKAKLGTKPWPVARREFWDAANPTAILTILAAHRAGEGEATAEPHSYEAGAIRRLIAKLSEGETP